MNNDPHGDPRRPCECPACLLHHTMLDRFGGNVEASQFYGAVGVMLARFMEGEVSRAQALELIDLASNCDTPRQAFVAAVQNAERRMGARPPRMPLERLAPNAN